LVGFGAARGGRTKVDGGTTEIKVIIVKIVQCKLLFYFSLI